MKTSDRVFCDRSGLRRSFFLLLLGASAALGISCGSEQPPSAPASMGAQCAGRQGAAMPPALRAAVQLARQSEGGAAYLFSSREAAAGFAAANPRFGFSAQLSHAGLTLRMGGGSAAAEPGLGVSLSHFGCAEAPASVPPVAPRLHGHRV